MTSPWAPGKCDTDKSRNQSVESRSLVAALAQTLKCLNKNAINSAINNNL